MKAFVAYAAPLLSFIAAMTALLGPSRKPDQIGLASLTGFGWAAAAFAVIGLTFTIYNATVQQSALRRAEDQLRSMRRVAQSEFQDGMNLILDILRFAALMPYTGRSIQARLVRCPTRGRARSICAASIRSTI